MDSVKRQQWDQITAKLHKEMEINSGLQERYEEFRAEFESAGGNAEASPGAAAAAKQMQDIEGHLQDLWKPHREYIGACSKCMGTRTPGMMPDGFGFGCLGCHDFEIYGAVAK